MDEIQPAVTKPKAQRRGNNELVSRVEKIEARVEKLEKLVVKLASMTGQGNMLREFGLKMWKPGKSDMSKYKN